MAIGPNSTTQWWVDLMYMNNGSAFTGRQGTSYSAMAEVA